MGTRSSTLKAFPRTLAALAVLLLPAAAEAEEGDGFEQPGWVEAVAFSPDGKLLASGGRDGAVKVWDLATKEQRSAWKAPAAVLGALAFGPGGKTVVAVVADGSLRRWEWATGRERRIVRGPSGRPSVAALSPDQKTVATAYDARPRPGRKTETHKVTLWDADTGKERRSLLREPAYAASLAFSPDGKTLAVGGTVSGVGLWDTITGLLTSAVGEDATWPVTFSPDGNALATGTRFETVIVWDPAKRKRLATFGDSVHPVMVVAFSPDGMRLAVGSVGVNRSIVTVSDVATGAVLADHLTGDGSHVRCLAFSPDGKILAAGLAVGAVEGGRGRVRLWDAAPGKKQDK